MKTWVLILVVLRCASMMCLADDASNLAGKGMDALRQKHYNLAEGYFSQAIRFNTNYVGAYYYRALSYIGTTQYDKSIADLDHALLLNTNDADAYYLRGLCYFKKSEFEKSITDFDHALLLKTNIITILLRADAYLYITNNNKAIEDYTKAIHIDPSYINGYLSRASVYISEGSFGLAIMDCNAALLIDHGSARAYHERGNAYNGAGDFDSAIADYSKAIKLYPNDASAYYSRASAFAASDDFSNAVLDCSSSIKLNPKSAAAYSDRSSYRTEIGDYSGALDDCKKAICLDPNLFWGYNNQAWLMAVCPDSRFRNGREAVEYAKKACDLTRWKEPACIDTLAAAYAEEGNYKNAVKWERKALEGLSSKNSVEGQKALHLYEQGIPYREAPK